MSERFRQHLRGNQDLSSTAETGTSNRRRNFDPMLLTDDTSISVGITWLLGGAGLGLAAAGAGIGMYFYQKGEAEVIRAEKGQSKAGERVHVARELERKGDSDGG